MDDKASKFAYDLQSSSPRHSCRSLSPLSVITRGFNEGSVSFLENLEIGEIIGQGSYGKVYEALYLPKHKHYAVKKIQLDCLDHTQYELVRTEVTNMLSVNHPGLLKLENSQTWATFVVMVMPLMVYTSCDQILQTAYPTGLPEAAIGMIIRDVVNAVSYLHAKNIIHRTIKASHVLIRESGAAVLSGFRHMLTIPFNQESMTVHNIMREMGRYINWMSPEMLRQDSHGFGLNSDLYSIGIMICELANGVVPYSDVSPSGILVKKLKETPPKLWEKNCLPSQENDGVAPFYFPGDPSGIMKSCPDNPYQKKLYSQHIKKFVAVCTVSPSELRINIDQATKFKFYSIYSKESPAATLRNLPLLGPPLKYTSGAGQASPDLESNQHHVEWELS